ncbi:hypothetical protein BDK51DRAFT_47580 [Blyttiomyces helicus]|uniref:Uncharacterized protein n=1 Tax=Blyttiomyces helicus TaxID=388810 RepID=A0A4P9VY76_9FUNG|nr:hypothetical protein BDK51DRAFT_47580 [Blyttiomyces helicus]|eukprot:RKO83895.1 hypothetical protein BDK51DRAFT_47580 [Blyttiomyces helicus]
MFLGNKIPPVLDLGNPTNSERKHTCGGLALLGSSSASAEPMDVQRVAQIGCRAELGELFEKLAKEEGARARQTRSDATTERSAKGPTSAAPSDLPLVEGLLGRLRWTGNFLKKPDGRTVDSIEGAGRVPTHAVNRLQHFMRLSLWSMPCLIGPPPLPGLAAEVGEERSAFMVLVFEVGQWVIVSVPAAPWSVSCLAEQCRSQGEKPVDQSNRWKIRFEFGDVLPAVGSEGRSAGLTKWGIFGPPRLTTRLMRDSREQYK